MGVAARRERRVAFHTFGCKLNQFETEALASSFIANGFTVVAVDTTPVCGVVMHRTRATCVWQ